MCADFLGSYNFGRTIGTIEDRWAEHESVLDPVVGDTSEPTGA